MASGYDIRRPPQARQARGSVPRAHLVFITKYRRGVLDDDMLRYCERAMRQYTGRVNRATMNGHFWPPSYLAASCGGAPLPIIRQYIDQQQRPA
jgi:REP element-mobilizing transposase RayT